MGGIPDLTAEQVDTAFGNGPGQIGHVDLEGPRLVRPGRVRARGPLCRASRGARREGDHCLESFSTFTTSATKNLSDDAPVVLDAGRAAVTLEAQSVTTFVAR
jgi:hypothetical protein